MLLVKRFTFNPLAEHTYLVYEDKSREAALIDPGCCNMEEEQRLHAFIVKEKLQLRYILNTHCHVDHVLGNAYAKQTYGIPLAIHPAEVNMLALAISHAPYYGIPNYTPTQADIFLMAGEKVLLGDDHLTVHFVPGHSPGHIAFYSQSNGICFSGDVLFKGFIGRTDLPGGDEAILLNSIKEVLFNLPDEVIIYPGHGACTTIGAEKKHNPFFQ